MTTATATATATARTTATANYGQSMIIAERLH